MLFPTLVLAVFILVVGAIGIPFNQFNRLPMSVIDDYTIRTILNLK
jgi:hypothetical protein